MKYKWILFDADGTLFDYDSAESHALKETLNQFGAQITDDTLKRYRRINKTLFTKLEQGRISFAELRIKRFELLLPGIGVNLHIEKFSNQYLNNLSKYSMLLLGAYDTISTLHPHCKMLIITNGTVDVQRSRFNRSAIKPFISDIVISDEIGVAKPAKEIFHFAFEKMGRPGKEQVILVGDSLTADIAGGINFGFDTCWYNPKRIKNSHDLEVTYEIAELKKLVDIVFST